MAKKKKKPLSNAEKLLFLKFFFDVLKWLIELLLD